MPYPDNMPAARTFTDDLRCTNPECDHTWSVQFIRDLGMTDFVDPNDAICPECGEEGE